MQNKKNVEPTKKSLWPEPDFRADAKNGLVDPKHAVLFMLIYENILRKPAPKNTAIISAVEWIDAYVEVVLFLKSEYENGNYTAIRPIAKKFKNLFSNENSEEIAELKLFAASKSKNGYLLGVLSLNKNQFIRSKSLLDIGWLDNDEVRSNDAFGACEVTQRNSKDLHWMPVRCIGDKPHFLGDAIYDNYEEALEAARLYFKDELAVRAQSSDGKSIDSALTTITREGADHRQGRDIVLSEFKDKFKFRDVEFGKSIRNKERQLFLNVLHDALCDLTSLFGLPVTFASLGGRLAIAYGSRGSRKGSAHYDRGEELIHFTKTSCYGALAHEFAHALDHYLGNQQTGQRKLLTEHFKAVVSIRNNEELGKILGQSRWVDTKAFENMLYALIFDTNGEKREFIKFSEQRDRKSTATYWTDIQEIFARCFECWCDESLKSKGMANDFLVQKYGYKINNTYPNGADKSEIVDEVNRWVVKQVGVWLKK